MGMTTETQKVRAWWWAKQGLDGSMRGRPAAEVLERAGWARSVAGAAPYLTMWSRAGIGRQQVDQAVAALEIHELPSARGCTYVVPAAHFPLALGAAAALGELPDIKTARKLGVSNAELDRLCRAVVDALEDGPLDPEQIRERTGKAARNLGEAGKKKGMITTLPVALGMLQIRGSIRRVPVNGRLDQQRYRYTLWDVEPAGGEVITRLARLYFEWIGPAPVADFQAFAGIGGKAAKAAVETLGLVPSGAGELLMLPEERDDFEAFRPPEQPQYALTGSLDALVLLRRNVATLVEGEGAGEVAGLSDLPSHAIFDRGRLVGLWEFDPDAGTIAWRSFIPPDDSLRAAVQKTEVFVRDELGDARAFSLDSPKSRRPRIEALRKAASK